MSEYLAILFAALFAENIVVAKLLGVYTLVGSSKTFGSANGMGLAVVFTTITATILSWPVYTLFLVPRGLDYLALLVFFLIAAAMAKLSERLLAKSAGAKSNFALVLINSAVLGVSIIFTRAGYTFGQSISYAIGASLGYWLAIVVFYGVRKRISNSPVPESFKGMPITLVAAAIVSMSFAGFGGVAENLFK